VEVPEFNAVNSDGSQRGIKDLRGRATLLWFYMLAGTPEDTAAGQALSALVPDFEALGVRVVGVGMNEAEKNKFWAMNEKFAFELWTDRDHKLSLALGAIPNEFALVPRRGAVLLDADARLLADYREDFDPKATPARALMDARARARTP
jgi:peroxiredoxin Q/BCP